MNDAGYFSSQYAASFSEFGEVLELPYSGMYVLKRHIDGPHFDAVGLYPFSVCENWQGLELDLEYLKDKECVSFFMVVDPMSFDNTIADISKWNVAKPFKTHFIFELNNDWNLQMSRTVRRYCKRSRVCQDVEVHEKSVEYAELFWSLYERSILRHGMSGLQRMSLDSISQQLSVPGAQLFIARREGKPLGAMIAFNQGEVANLHLIGLAKESYKFYTSYALIHESLLKLKEQGCSYANLGGAAGVENDLDDGLYQFKRRWTKSTREAWIFGQILMPEAYALLVDKADCDGANTFFPAYRSPGSIYQ